ncbi:hypothetical protein EGI22_19065 [Lacihabitans sp. LS3-19]|uniref:S8 family serine peptidase n=1 Tax=Lacihabitans sp. LS3-19 TaxID=2487335 RepID=UPI0020CDA4E3|nr:S8 family serine peptidase [Lacihabitans sp. LS3-19]MCP9770008.1 hypothetical protein [Lacihabitans sp. LS3-19]
MKNYYSLILLILGFLNILKAQTVEKRTLDSFFYYSDSIKTINSIKFNSQIDLLIQNDLGEIRVDISYKIDELNSINNAKIDTALLQNYGFKVLTVYKNHAIALISFDKLMQLSEKLSSDYFITPIYNITAGQKTKSLPISEGPELQNSSSYINGTSLGGEGIKIAIIDAGFQSINWAITNNIVKTPVYMWANGGQITDINILNSGQSVHGTAVFEAIFNHAPNAEFELYDIDISATSQAAAITQALANGCKILNLSVTCFDDKFTDNSGVWCDAANTASQNNAIVFKSAGNSAKKTWVGQFKDSNNNNLHEWLDLDEKNVFNPNDPFFLRLSWELLFGADLDLLLYRVDTLSNGTTQNILVGSGTNNGWNYETVSLNPGTNKYFFQVRNQNPSVKPKFKITTNLGISSYQYYTEESSVDSPHSTNPNVMTVGAVDSTKYLSPAFSTDIITSYSSRGPSISGNLAPNFVAPTGTYSFVYGGDFTGTSCSSPNAAGMAAAFWSAHPYLIASGVCEIITRKAEMYKDWGDAGPDNIYGNGGVYLYDYVPNTYYVHQEGGNIVLPSLPYRSLQTAQNSVPTNSSLFLLDKTNVFTQTLGVGSAANKNIKYITAKGFGAVVK